MKQIIRKILSEMDFSFTDEIEDAPEEYKPQVGDKIVWMRKGRVVDYVYTITDIVGDTVTLQWHGRNNLINQSDIGYKRLVNLYNRNLDDDTWIELVNEQLNEMDFNFTDEIGERNIPQVGDRFKWKNIYYDDDTIYTIEKIRGRGDSAIVTLSYDNGRKTKVRSLDVIIKLYNNEYPESWAELI